MKNFITITLLFAIVSCGSNNNELKQKKSIKGIWKENEFKNEFFDISFSIDSNWIKNEKNRASVFGGVYLDASHHQLNKNGSQIAEIKINYDKINPFDNEESIQNELKKSREGFQMLYDSNELEFVPFEKKSFSKHNFLRNRIIIKDPENPLVIDEYIKKEGDYFLSIIISYSSPKGLSACNQFLATIK